MRTSDPLLTPFSLLPPAAVRLGRLTTNIYDPITAHIDPAYPLDLLSTHTIRYKLSKHHVNVRSGSGVGGTFSLTRIFRFSAQTSSASINNLQLEDIEMFRISNSEDFFHTASVQPRVKNWLANKSTYAKPVYLITGYAIAGSISGETIQNKGVSSDAAMEPTQGAAFCADDDAMIISGGVGGMTQTRNQTEAVERTVCGVMYRKVKFQFFKKTHVMSENDRQWTVNLPDTRGKETEETTVEGELDSDVSRDGSTLEGDLEKDKISFKKYYDEEGNAYFVLGDEDEGSQGGDGDGDGGDDDDSDAGWET